MADALSQIVYVLTNPAMPGIVKIGRTTQLEVEERMKQLYSTGVPVPFDCAFACQVAMRPKSREHFISPSARDESIRIGNSSKSNPNA